MELESTFKSAIGLELGQISYPDNLNVYRGKVRDCIIKPDGTRVIITTDRLSAFDRQICLVPFKGQMLNTMSRFWLEKSANIVPNHMIEVPHPNVMISRELEIIPVEVVIRAYLAGSSWRSYQRGEDVSGVKLPPGLSKNQKLPEVIITPSTKAEIGEHDEPISEQEIIARGLVDKKLWEQIREVSFALFKEGARYADSRGLTLVDTKYEFGLLEGKLYLADEVHTQDSSRYWIKGTEQMLDKEFVREKLMSLGYQGEGEVPKLTEEFIVQVALRYAETFKMITGNDFTPVKVSEADILKLI